VFHVLKDIFKFRKLPYKGLAKNAARLLFSYANVNLYMLAIAGRRADGAYRPEERKRGDKTPETAVLSHPWRLRVNFFYENRF
jgi:hypothetical protein